MDKAKRVPIKEQDGKSRASNFYEVCLGYTDDEAKAEAARCLNCKNAKCIDGCPVNINIPAFIAEISKDNIDKAYEIISESSALPAVCGRVCPQEKQCEARCARGIKGESIAIGKLERYVADKKILSDIKTFKNPYIFKEKVAVIGSGPSGLTCAGELVKNGYNVTVFEALHELGGVLVYGIPEFRLPKDKVVKPEIEKLKAAGVKFETDVIIGKSITIDELFNDENFSAVYIGSGAGLPKFMGIKGESANGVFSANEILTRNNLMRAYRDDYDTPIKIGKTVVVVGGGNVAMDAARTAVRLGANVKVVYRRGEEELPARKEEIKHAKEEGVVFELQTNPVEILTDDTNSVIGVKLIRTELGEPDTSGRRSPRDIRGSEYVLDCDSVIMSLGTSPNPLIASTTDGVQTDERKRIIVDENCLTTKNGVFAGGDAVTGAATVILAMEAGKKAAKSIMNFLNKK